MTIRHALFIDGAWIDAGADSWSALVTVNEEGVDIKPYNDAEVTDWIRFTFEEFAAIAELVAKAQGKATL
jgi:hypothetical protein